MWDRTFLEELLDNYDDEYDEIDPQFAQEYGSIINGIHNRYSVSEKAKKGDKGIELAKNIYALNGQIYLNKDIISYKGMKIFRIFLIWSAWIIILLGILVGVEQPIFGIVCIV